MEMYVCCGKLQPDVCIYARTTFFLHRLGQPYCILCTVIGMPDQYILFLAINQVAMGDGNVNKRASGTNCCFLGRGGGSRALGF